MGRRRCTQTQFYVLSLLLSAAWLRVRRLLLLTSHLIVSEQLVPEIMPCLVESGIVELGERSRRKSCISRLRSLS
jgi:hypothetical protein